MSVADGQRVNSSYQFSLLLLCRQQLPWLLCSSLLQAVALHPLWSLHDVCAGCPCFHVPLLSNEEILEASLTDARRAYRGALGDLQGDTGLVTNHLGVLLFKLAQFFTYTESGKAKMAVMALREVAPHETHTVHRGRVWSAVTSNTHCAWEGDSRVQSHQHVYTHNKV